MDNLKIKENTVILRYASWNLELFIYVFKVELTRWSNQVINRISSIFLINILHTRVLTHFSWYLSAWIIKNLTS